MIISVMFEFLEYSLEHQLPNFSECWWDHVCTHIPVLLCLLNVLLNTLTLPQVVITLFVWSGVFFVYKRLHVYTLFVS